MDGLWSNEVWMQTVEPGVLTPVHYHDCEEVIMIIRGTGQLSIEDKVIEFGPNHTLIIPLILSINSYIVEVKKFS